MSARDTQTDIIMATPPPMFTKRQAAAFLQCSEKSLERMLADGSVRYVKLGRGRSAPVRIPSAQFFGDPESKRQRARRSRQADAEYHLCAARLGLGGAS